MANLLGDFAKYTTLAELPALVRQQRKYAALLVDKNGNKVVELEKAIRAQIDALLVACGFKSGDGVTCHGYAVVHREQRSQSRLDETKAVEQLVALGVDREAVVQVFKDCTTGGEPGAVKFCEVDPAPGAKVRRPAA